jgi:multiple sugar transport system permease protein
MSGVARHERSRSPWLLTLVITAVALLVNLPLIAAVLASLKTDAQIIGDPLGLPDPLILDHYRNVLYAAGYDFPKFFRNSTLIATSSVLSVLAIATPASYAIVRLGLGGRWLLSIVASLRLLPAIFFILPIFVMFARLGIIDTILGMVIVSTFLNLPIAMVLLSRGVNDTPKELEEAAAVDGAGPIRTLRSIVLPILAPTMVATAVITFLFTWNDFLFAVVVTTSNARTVTVGAANFITSYGVLWGDVSAAVVLGVLVPIAFAVLAQRYLVSGLSAGAVKE